MKIKGNPRVIYDDDESAILLNMRTGSNYLLNSSAGPVWWLLTQGVELGKAIKIIAESFDISPERLESDMKPVIDDLIRLKFLQSENSKPRRFGRFRR
jgi:Coenzyme PQQ synthesis protein D (PqqD)